MRNILTILCCLGLLATAETVWGFLPNPDLLVVSPAVAKAGTTVEVSVSGKELDEAKTLRFSDDRIVVEPVMRPADAYHPEPRPVDGRFKVTVPADAEPGVYEVRSRGYFGLSTARPFMVLPAEGKELVEEGDHSTVETALPLDVETGLFGTLERGKFDWYRFSAKQGERLLLQVWAERLDSKGDLLMAVVDAEGRELESSRHHFGRDPFVDFTAPADGEYFVSLSDALYGGGKEYFYHLRVGRGPHIDFVFPPAGEPGKKQTFTVFGRNLPEGSLGGNWSLEDKPLETLEVNLDVPAEVTTPDSHHWGIPRQGILPAFEYSVGSSDPVRIGFATVPVVTEDSEAEEQKIEIPAEVAGRFDEKGDADQFRFSAKKDTVYWIEVISHRLGAVTDPFVKVERIKVDEAGEETFEDVAENDDLPSYFGRDFLDDLNADSLDPALHFTADADAEYRVSLVNRSAGGSAAHLYRLAVREAQPDFQLLVGTELTKTINNDAFPAAPLVRQGGSMVYRVLALRRDGFDGDIVVTAEGLPEGVTAEPLVLSGETRQGFLTVWADAEAPEWGGTIDISGVATIEERETKRLARPASIIWGHRVFARSAQVRSRLDMETVLSVMATETEPTRMAAAEDKEWTVEIGDTLEIPIELTETGRRVGNLQVGVHGFPGLHRAPPTVSVPEKDKEATLKFPFKPTGNFELEPGRYQFVLQGVGNAKYRHNPAAAERAEAEKKRLEGLSEAFAGKVDEAKNEVASAEKELAEAQQTEAAAADDEARKGLEEETAAARKRLDEAKQDLKTREADLERLASLKTAAEKAATATASKAAEKNNQFATYSQPITVVVKAAAEK
ncbi:MAG: PPC domain-containing protein [Verrucomicrobiales bacterium]